MRQKDKAASTLFYIPNDAAEAAHHEGKTTAVHKLQNLQNTLRLGFSDMKYFMDNKLTVDWELEYGGKIHKVKLRFAIAYIVSDTAMHDKLCSHFSSRGHGIKAICRHCTCPTESLADPKVFKVSSLIHPDMVDPKKNQDKDEEYWKGISHHPIKPALDELEHGSNKHKTHLNTCGEVLHMHQLGAMKRIVESLEHKWLKGTGVLVDKQSVATMQKNIKTSMESFNHATKVMA